MRNSLFYLVLSDYKRAYVNSWALSSIARGLVNSSLHACVMVRMCQCSPSFIFPILRRLLIAFHSIDVGRGLEIGPALSLPHPVGIVLGAGVRMGEGVSIFQGVTIGVANGFYPVIGDKVTIYPNAVLVGNVTVASGTRIRALQFVGSGRDPVHVGEVSPKESL